MVYGKPDWTNPDIKKTEIQNSYLSASKVEIVIPAERVTQEIFDEMARDYPEILNPEAKAIWERYVAKVMSRGPINHLKLEDFLLREDIGQVFHYHMLFSCLTGEDFVNLWQIYDLPDKDFPWSRINWCWSSREENDQMEFLGKISEKDLGFLVKIIVVSFDRGIASDQVRQEENICYSYNTVIRCLLRYAKLTSEQEKALCEVYKFSHSERDSEYPGYMIEYSDMICHKHIPLRRKILMDEGLRKIILSLSSDKLRERTLIQYASLATEGSMSSMEGSDDEEDMKLFSRFLWSIIEFVNKNDLEYTFDYVLLDIFKYLDEQQHFKLLQEHVLRGGTIDINIDDENRQREMRWRRQVFFLESCPEKNMQGIICFGAKYSDKLLEMIEESLTEAKLEKAEKDREHAEETRRKDKENGNDIEEMKKYKP